MFESHHTFPAELFPQIVQHASITDLHVYTLVNSFFQSLAQPALFSLVRMVHDVDGRLHFFESLRGAQLIKHAKSLVLGPEFFSAQDQLRASSFLLALEHTQIHTLHIFSVPAWHDIPENTLTGLYTFVMPHLRTLAFSTMPDLPFTEILSHCVMLKYVKFDFCRTSDSNATNLQTLPNIRSIDLVHWNTREIGTQTSLGAYLEAKGSSIEALTVGGYPDDTHHFPIGKFAYLMPHLREFTVEALTLHTFLQYQPLRFDNLQQLHCVYLKVNLSYINWTIFLDFLDQHFKQKYFPPSLKDIHVRVIRDTELPEPANSSTTGSHDETVLRLPSAGNILLHVILHIKDRIAEENNAAIQASMQEYDVIQRQIESCLSPWVQAGRLIVTREVWYI